MALLSSINKVFSIRAEEQKTVYLLLLQTVFLGGFFALFDISATSLFINTYGEAMLSKAFLISGILGLTLTTIYYKLQLVWPFSKLIVINLLTISLFTLLTRMLFFVSEGNWVIFMVFVLMGPLNLLGVVGFWGMAGRLFTLRQGKRLFSLIDSGQIFGMILISFLVPILLNAVDSSKDLLFISAGSMFTAFLIQLIIVKQFDLNKEITTAQKDEKLHAKNLLKNKYLLNMTLYVVLSMLAAFFMFYIFLPTTKMLYPGDNQYTVFLGMFTGTLMIFTFLIKTLAYDKLTKNYGLKVNLLLPPIMLILFVLFAVGAGLIFGISSASTSFVLFFLFVALGRLFSVSLKNAIEVPSQKILYQSLNKSIRYKVQVAIDGMVNEFSAISAGAILFVLGMIDFFTSIHYSIFLIGIAIAWAWVGRNVYREYRKSLGATLAEGSSQTNTDIITFAPIIPTDIEIPTNILHKIICLEQHIDPCNFQLFSKNILRTNTEIKKNILEIIDNKYLYDSLPLLDSITNERNDELESTHAKKIITRFKESIEEYQTKERFTTLISSVYPTDRIKAAEIIAYTKNKDLYGHILILLRDYSSEVKIAAIKTAASVKEINSIPTLLDFLSDEHYSIYAYEALKRFGANIIEQLEQYFFKSGIAIPTQIQIIELMRLAGQKAHKSLLNKLNQHNYLIIEKTLNALLTTNYKPHSDTEKQTFIELIHKEIGIAAWIINVQTQALQKQLDKPLIESIENEHEKCLNKIYLLLSILYDESAVQQVRKNLEVDTSESNSFAIELLDLFIEDELKVLLFILFDDVTLTEKVRRFSDHFPLPKSEDIPLIHSIINRNSNHISRYTKALAMKTLVNLKNENTDNTSIAQMFSSDRLLSELAALIVAKQNIETYKEVTKRLSPEKRHHLDQIALNREQTLFEIFENCYTLDIFKEQDKEYLLEIIEHGIDINIEAGNRLTITNNNFEPTIIISGSGQYIENEKENIYKQGMLLTKETYGKKTDIDIIPDEDTTILKIPLTLLFNIASNRKKNKQLITSLL